MDLLNTLKLLVSTPGASGQEEKVCDTIRTLAAPFVDECTVDIMGNLICHKRGSGPKVMFAAHMDSIGLIVTHIDKDGFLRFGNVGWLPAAAIYQQPVRFTNGTVGTIAVTQNKEGKSFQVSDLYIDIGAKDAEEAKSMVSVGDTAVFASATYSAGTRIISPYLDNRAGCLVLLMAMEALSAHASVSDLYFVFTVQEEVGLRGAKTAAYAIDPDYGIAVDVTDSDDVPETIHSGSAKLGKGAAVKLMDRSIICHPQMVQLLDRLAQDKQIPSQHDIIHAGGTDAGVIHTTHMGVITGGISIPTRYLHTPTEMADRSDLQACADLIKAFAESELPAV